MTQFKYRFLRIRWHLNWAGLGWAGNKEDKKEDCAGAGCNGDTCNQASIKRIFVTASYYTGDLKTAGNGVDGIDGADKLCQQAADTGQLGGEWMAWVSTSSSNAIDRLPNVGPWYFVDETTMVFRSKPEIQLTPLTKINMGELGMEVETNAGIGDYGHVITGTNHLGRYEYHQDEACSAYTDDTTTSVYFGSIRFSNGEWTKSDFPGLCSGYFHLYCFEK